MTACIERDLETVCASLLQSPCTLHSECRDTRNTSLLYCDKALNICSKVSDDGNVCLNNSNCGMSCWLSIFVIIRHIYRLCSLVVYSSCVGYYDKKHASSEQHYNMFKVIKLGYNLYAYTNTFFCTSLTDTAGVIVFKKQFTH